MVVLLCSLDRVFVFGGLSNRQPVGVDGVVEEVYVSNVGWMLKEYAAEFVE